MSDAVIGEYYATPPTLTDREQKKLRLTSDGSLVVSGTSGGGAMTVADGADVAEGATTDAVVAAGAAGTVSAKLRRISTDLDAFKTANHTDLIAATPAGTNLIGKVGIDQTTPGTTNGVVVNSSALPTGGSTSANQTSELTKLDTLHTDLAAFTTANHADLTAATPAGTNLIGKVGIDQTTPGTTNGTVPAGGVASGATDSGNPIKVAGKYNATKPTFTDGQRGDFQIGTRGAVVTQLQLPDNANAVGFQGSGSDAVANNTVNAYNSFTFSNVFNGTTWDRAKKPNVYSRLLSSAASTNATSVKATPGDVFKFTGNNTTATKRYLKFYNKASAPTVGTDTPVLTFPLLGSAAFDISITQGAYFSTGIAYAITGAAADADTTAVLAGDIECLNILYA